MEEYIKKSDLKDELLHRDFFPVIVKRALEAIPAADVVPKAVVEQLQRELDEETARLRSILDNYALQYGTVKDQHEVIDRVKRETAMEIFGEIETCLCSKNASLIRGDDKLCIRFEDYETIKKKYMEDKK